ncbi:hypothetical protein BJX99DRAFT_81226 [Aspergillus californicus]
MDILQISSNLPPTPTALPNCCLSLSTTLTTHLSTLLPPKPAFALSIGSGSGLLEALIAHRHDNLSIEGVEVSSSVNLYIAEKDMNTVAGTWDLSDRAGQAKAWIFVYPREPGLVRRYIDAYRGEGSGELILWLGPRADWEDYEGCFIEKGFEIRVQEGIGMAEFEMLVVARRSF